MGKVLTGAVRYGLDTVYAHDEGEESLDGSAAP